MLIQAVDTCLSSKVVSQNCETISPMAVDAVLGIIDAATASNVDLRDIKVPPQYIRAPSNGAWLPRLAFAQSCKAIAFACMASVSGDIHGVYV